MKQTLGVFEDAVLDSDATMEIAERIYIELDQGTVKWLFLF